jgi:acyl dehydratase
MSAASTTIGTRLTARRTVDAAAIAECARLTGDAGAHHLAGLGGRQVSQGLLTVAVLPIIGDPGVLVRSMSLNFIAPVFADQEIEATVELAEVTLTPEGRERCTFTLSAGVGETKPVLRGTAVIDVPRPAGADGASS